LISAATESPQANHYGRLQTPAQSKPPAASKTEPNIIPTDSTVSLPQAQSALNPVS